MCCCEYIIAGRTIATDIDVQYAVLRIIRLFAMIECLVFGELKASEYDAGRAPQSPSRPCASDSSANPEKSSLLHI